MTRLQVAAAGLLVFFFGTWPSHAQEVDNLSAPAVKSKSYVAYDSEQQMVRAGKREVVQLRFQVADGFHVNSHTPKSELLIPTTLVLKPEAGIETEAIRYPAGTQYSFSVDPANKLDVYSGGFTVQLPVVAVSGLHTIDGTLRYQACDHAACYPPKILPVQVVVLAR